MAATRKKRAAPPSARAKTGRHLPVTVFKAWCKKCGICMAFCPKNVLEPGIDGHPEPVRPDDCIYCHQCELRCPDFAITVNDKEEAP